MTDPRYESGAKSMSESAITIGRTMTPGDANPWGFVHGGTIMKMVDEAAGTVAIRHSRKRVATAAVDYMSFLYPVEIGDLVTDSTLNPWQSPTCVHRAGSHNHSIGPERPARQTAPNVLDGMHVVRQRLEIIQLLSRLQVRRPLRCPGQDEVYLHPWVSPQLFQ